MVHLALSPLVFWKDTLDIFEANKVALLQLAALAAAAFALSEAVRGWVRGQPARLAEGVRALAREPIALGVLLFLVSAAVSTAASISPHTSLRGTPESDAGLFTVLAYAVLFFATRRLCWTAEEGERLLAASVLGAGAASVYAVLQAAGLDPMAWGDVSGFGGYLRPFGTMGNPNHLGGFLAAAWPLSAWFAFRAARSRQWLPLAVLASTCGLMGVAVVLSLSRAAWAALACAAAVLLAAWVRGPLRRKAAAAGVLLVVAGLAVLAMGGTGGRELLGKVVERARHGSDPEGRLHIWAAGLRLFRERPLAGWGLDAFQLAFGRERTPAYWQVEWNLTPARAHNEAIHVLATQGLLGGAALAVLLGGLVWAALSWRRYAAEERLFRGALLAGVAAFAVQSLFSFTVAGTGTLFVTLAALLSRSAGFPGEERPGGPPGRGAGWVTALLVADGLASLVFLVNLGPASCLAGGRPALVLVAVVAILGLLTWAVVKGSGQDSAGGISCSRKLQLAANGRRLKPAATECGPPVASSRRLKPAATPLCPLTPSVQGGVATAQRVIPASGTGRQGVTGARWRPRVGAALTLAIWAVTLGLLIQGILRPLRASLLCREGDELRDTDWKGALERYARAAALDPGEELYWARVGTTCQNGAAGSRVPDRRRELLGQAREALEKAVSLTPASPYRHADLAQLLVQLARDGLAPPGQALGEFDRALEVDGQNAYLYAEAGNAALTLGDPLRARLYAGRGALLYPDFGPVRALAGYLALGEGRLEEAAGLLERALAGDSDWHGDEAGRTRGWRAVSATYLRLGRFEDASRAARFALGQAPRNAELRLILARSLEGLGRPEEAAAEYQQVLTLDPDQPFAREAARRLGR